MVVKSVWRAALAVVAVVLAATAADARPWKPSPAAQAQDYLQIQHIRSGGEIVLLLWIAPPMVQVQPAMQDLLDKYILLAVVHGRPGPAGAVLFDDVPAPNVFDGNGKTLRRFTDADMPPDMAQGVMLFSGIMKQSLGATGEGMKFFVYEGDGVGACKAGKLSVTVDGETYTYDTPIPGCPK